ncbi:sorting nexin-5-like [Littorina saxatilis]|uniref:PX domain-containing protein n=1 Tax=Littorina saxatilis TaxID=31220 RepID=A0AAN9B0A0_9CAEN
MSNDEESPTVPFEDSDDPDQEDDGGFTQDVTINTGTLPLFRVSVTEAVKDGLSLQFTIMATRIEGDRGLVVSRQFEDLEWLHHQLVAGNDTEGIIVPPLPMRPEFDPKSAESKTKKQLGSDCNILRPDDFDLECKAVEKYLSLMLSHQTFGRDKNLETFLCEKEAPVRTKVSKGIMGWLSTTIDSARKSQHKDIDDYFGKQRVWAVEYTRVSREASLNFNKVTQSQWRLTSGLQHLSTSLSATLPFKDDSTRAVNKLTLKFAEAVESSRKGLEAVSQTDEKTLGFELDLLARYMDSVKEMLFQRTCLMIVYEDACKALEKAKPQKKQAAEEAKIAAEGAYAHCCENAKKELKTFMRQRILTMQDGLVAFTESQIRTSRDVYSNLVQVLKDVEAEA